MRFFILFISECLTFALMYALQQEYLVLKWLSNA